MAKSLPLRRGRAAAATDAQSVLGNPCGKVAIGLSLVAGNMHPITTSPDCLHPSCMVHNGLWTHIPSEVSPSTKISSLCTCKRHTRSNALRSLSLS